MFCLSCCSEKYKTGSPSCLEAFSSFKKIERNVSYFIVLCLHQNSCSSFCIFLLHEYDSFFNPAVAILPFPDVALSSGLMCHDPSSPSQGCCSDGAVLLGGFGGPLTQNLTVSSVEYLGPEEEHSLSGSVCGLSETDKQLIDKGLDVFTSASKSLDCDQFDKTS